MDPNELSSTLVDLLTTQINIKFLFFVVLFLSNKLFSNFITDNLKGLIINKSNKRDMDSNKNIVI
jgi:hypothetical protein